MQNFIRLTFCAGLSLCLVVMTPASDQDTPQALARRAADQWLALLDAGRYSESWDAASEGFKAAVKREDWESQLKARTALGKLISRKLKKSDVLNDPPNAPPGNYVSILYQSSFENLASAVELVIPRLEKDGKWRVSNYLVRHDE